MPVIRQFRKIKHRLRLYLRVLGLKGLWYAIKGTVCQHSGFLQP